MNYNMRCNSFFDILDIRSIEKYNKREMKILFKC